MLTTLVISKYHCFTVSIHILKLALNILRDIKIGSAKKKRKEKTTLFLFESRNSGRNQRKWRIGRYGVIEGVKFLIEKCCNLFASSIRRQIAESCEFAQTTERARGLSERRPCYYERDPLKTRRALQSGCRHTVCALAAGSRRFSCTVMVQAAGRKCLVVPRVEPAGERTTCRRDRWGQTAVVHLYPRPRRAYPLLAPAPSTPHEMGAQRSPTPFCPFRPSAWISPPFNRHHRQGWLVLRLCPEHETDLAPNGFYVQEKRRVYLRFILNFLSQVEYLHTFQVLLSDCETAVYWKNWKKYMFYN